jgi:uncharacterized protein (TIGR00645 family)
MVDEPEAKPAAERVLELWLFRSRWLLAPIYVGLVLALVDLVVVFAADLIHATSELFTVHPKHVLVNTLSMIDVTLAANLILIVMFSGYEQFVARIDTGAQKNRLTWMGGVDFSGVKLRLMASLVAISAVALLRVFMVITDGEGAPDNRQMAWLVGIHLTFVVSGVLLALMDYLVAKSRR